MVTDKLKTLLLQINNKRIWLDSMLYKSKHNQIHTTEKIKWLNIRWLSIDI